MLSARQVLLSFARRPGSKISEPRLALRKQSRRRPTLRGKIFAGAAVIRSHGKITRIRAWQQRNLPTRHQTARLRECECSDGTRAIQSARSKQLRQRLAT